MTAAAKTRWQKVEAKELASAIFSEVERDDEKLKEGFTSVDSIWGKIAKRLLKKNTATDRLVTERLVPACAQPR